MRALFTPLFLIVPAVAMAAPKELKETLPNGASDLYNLIDTLGNWFFTIFTVIAVFVILLAAFNYLTANGSEEKVHKAHKMLIYAVIGIAVAFLAKGLVFVVAQLVGA